MRELTFSYSAAFSSDGKGLKLPPKHLSSFLRKGQLTQRQPF